LDVKIINSISLYIQLKQIIANNEKLTETEIIYSELNRKYNLGQNIIETQVR